jgi:hypothetical protein
MDIGKENKKEENLRPARTGKTKLKAKHREPS